MDALAQAERRVDELGRDFQRHVAPVVDRALQTAIHQMEQHLATAADIARIALESPLNLLRDTLQEMIKHPESLFNPTDMVNRQIDAIQHNVVDTMNRITDTVTRDAVGTLNDLAHPMGHAHDNRDKANRIAEAMRHLRQERTVAVLENLQRLTGGPPPDGSAIAAGAARAAIAHPTFLSRTIAKVDSGKLRARAVPQQINKDLAGKWAEAQRLHASLLREADSRGHLAVRQRVSADIGERFRGKSPAEIDAAKAELIREARRRFGNDPKVAQAAEQLINAAAVGVPAQAIRPTAGPSPATDPAARPIAPLDPNVPRSNPVPIR